MRLAFLASNNGSAMRKILSAIESGTLAATATLVVSNRSQSSALAFAQHHNIPGFYIPTLADAEGADRHLCQVMTSANIEIVILSGYLKKLGPKVLRTFKNRILNTHPALLPKFGRKG